MKKKIGLGIGVVVLAGLVVFGVVRGMLSGDLLSPLGIKKPEKKINYRVVGFLPTWMVGKTQDYCQEVTDLVFLGIEVNEKGDLIWDVQGKKVSGDDYIEQKAKIKKCGGKNIVGIKLFDDNKIEKLMASPEAIANLIEQTKSVVTKGGFDGVNIDFEYMGDPNWVLQDELLNLVTGLKKAGVGEISADVFANTVIKGSAEQIKRLLGEVDSLMVMAYDFHRPGSDFAGSVAPIGSVEGESNISQVVEKVVLNQLEKKKIIMLYPLYGYEWETETANLGAKTLPGLGWMASFDRVQKLIKNYELRINNEEKDLKINYDELSMTPWLSFKQTENITKTRWVKVKGKWKKQSYKVPVERIHQIYYDDLRSLKIKLDLAKQAGLGGVGFWALGYEGEDKTIWDEVSKLNKSL